VYQHIAGEVEILVCVRREKFSYKSPRERILKIGPNFPKLLSNIKGYTFLEHSVCNTRGTSVVPRRRRRV